MELKQVKGGTVRLSVPANVAADLGSFRKAVTGLAERLGCKPCVSGRDCLFQIQTDFLADERLEVRAVAGKAAVISGVLADGDPDGTSAISPRARVSVPAAVSGDLKKVLTVIDTIAGRLGCAACCSGFDLHFREELRHFADSQGAVHGFGG